VTRGIVLTEEPPAVEETAVLGIHDGHNAAAALVRGGVVEMTLQEERLTRIKNQIDVPHGAIQTALTLAARFGAR
jgi:predicted NodU family carbamoyl transferase